MTLPVGTLYITCVLNHTFILHDNLMYTVRMFVRTVAAHTLYVRMCVVQCTYYAIAYVQYT